MLEEGKVHFLSLRYSLFCSRRSRTFWATAVWLATVDCVHDKEEEPHDNEDLGPVSGPKVLSSMELEKWTGVYTVTFVTTDISDSFPTELDYPDSLVQLAEHIQPPQFSITLWQFLWQQLHPDSDLPAHTIPISDCPSLHSKLKVHHTEPMCDEWLTTPSSKTWNHKDCSEDDGSQWGG